MKLNIKSIVSYAILIASSVNARSCLKATKKGSWDGKEVIELDVNKDIICKKEAYELCTPLQVELLEISNVPKKNYEFDFGTTGLESDATLYHDVVFAAVDGNVQYFRIDYQTIYKNVVLLFGFNEDLCKNESPEDIEKIKVRVYGRKDSTDDPSTEFQPEEAISMDDPKIKMVQKQCFDNVLSFPYLFSQREEIREFLYDDLLQLREDDVIETEAFRKVNDLTIEFGKNKDTTCRNWLYILGLKDCYEAQEKLPEEFIFEEMPIEVINLLSDMDPKKLSKRLTMCLREIKPRKLKIEEEFEENYKKENPETFEKEEASKKRPDDEF